MMEEQGRGSRAVGNTYCHVCKFEFGNPGYFWLHVKNIHGEHRYAECARGVNRRSEAPRGKKYGQLSKPNIREIIRVALLKRDGRHCIWCGDRMDWPLGGDDKTGEYRRNPRIMTFEHIIRRRDGGKSTKDNLALACWRCNHERD